jgi:hypothetical protein
MWWCIPVIPTEAGGGQIGGQPELVGNTAQKDKG